MIEYIMLLSVVIFLAAMVFNSQGFKRIFGREGMFAQVYKAEMEHSYRHAIYGRNAFTRPNYNQGHTSYIQGGATRFFSAKDPYPKQ